MVFTPAEQKLKDSTLLDIKVLVYGSDGKNRLQCYYALFALPRVRKSDHIRKDYKLHNRRISLVRLFRFIDSKKTAFHCGKESV